MHIETKGMLIFCYVCIFVYEQSPSELLPSAIAWPYVAYADRDGSRLNGISLDTKRLFSLNTCIDYALDIRWVENAQKLALWI